MSFKNNRHRILIRFLLLRLHGILFPRRIRNRLLIFFLTPEYTWQETVKVLLVDYTHTLSGERRPQIIVLVIEMVVSLKTERLSRYSMSKSPIKVVEEVALSR